MARESGFIWCGFIMCRQRSLLYEDQRPGSTDLQVDDPYFALPYNDEMAKTVRYGESRRQGFLPHWRSGNHLMCHVHVPSLILLCFGFCVSFCEGVMAQQPDFATALMKSTFRVTGPAAAGQAGTTTGTAFILGKASKSHPDHAFYVLVTAAHVLDGIAGDVATVEFRTKVADGSYQPNIQPISIRKGGRNLYTKRPEADVAAMYVPVPESVISNIIPTDLLATDVELERIELHPGDTLFCLGFPLAIDLKTFPVLRTGVLASYSITPAKTVKQLYYNFAVFPGNSGGPVFYS